MNSRLPPTVFVGGIHGVGKSTFSRVLAAKTQRLHYSAGTLIAEHLKKKHVADKRVSDVQDNQDALIAALMDRGIGAPIVLDGHFCLLNRTGEVQDVPVSTFQALSLQMVIALQDDAQAIQDRLMKRDGRQYEVSFIRDFQVRELNRGRAVCQELQISFDILSGSDIAMAVQQVLSIH